MQCPGQDSRYWDGEAIFESKCPKCGGGVEFFKDDSKRRCRQCGHELLNPRLDFGCASYCPFAEQCLGSLPPEMLAQKQELLLQRVAIAMKGEHGDDFDKIGRATRTSRYAEELAKTEGANKTAVVVAALLTEVNGEPEVSGQRSAERARAILSELQATAGLIDEVAELIRHVDDPPGPAASVNSRVLHDAWLLARMAQMGAEPAAQVSAQEMRQALVTVNGRLQGEKLLA